MWYYGLSDEIVIRKKTKTAADSVSSRLPNAARVIATHDQCDEIEKYGMGGTHGMDGGEIRVYRI
jgi:hypothetical protein